MSVIRFHACQYRSQALDTFRSRRGLGGDVDETVDDVHAALFCPIPHVHSCRQRICTAQADALDEQGIEIY